MGIDEKFKDKIALAVQATDAIWTAEFVRLAGAFHITALQGDAAEQDFEAFLMLGDTSDWLMGALAAQRVRTRKVREKWGDLNCKFISIFPSPDGQRLLAVGTSIQRLNSVDQALFRAISQRLTAGPIDQNGALNGHQADKQRFEYKRVVQQVGGLDITELDFEKVLRQAVQRSREIVGGSGAELGLVDQGKKAVQVLWSDVPGGTDGPYLVPFGKDIIGQVAENDKPLLVNDYHAWPGRTINNPSYHSVVGVPLRFKGSVIGTLTVVDNTPERQFSDEDAYLLEALAAQITISIRNARLFQDLAERIKIQRASEGKLVEAARLAAIGEMAASVAHELNNPLTAICGFSELLMDEFPESSRQRENLALVLSEARRARDVVRRLLDFSRREKDLMSYFTINEAVSQVLALVQPMAVIHKVEIEFDSWEDLPNIYGDRNQIRQVLLNLVANGIQSMPSGGILTVQTLLLDDPEKCVAIRVADKGVGIPADFLDQIFDPFFTTKPVGSGTGLGLSISRNIIVDHGGDIVVESKEGEGTCFTVLLPIHNEKLEK